MLMHIIFLTHLIIASRILFVLFRSLGNIGPCSCDVKMKLVVASLTFCTSVKKVMTLIMSLTIRLFCSSTACTSS